MSNPPVSAAPASRQADRAAKVIPEPIGLAIAALIFSLAIAIALVAQHRANRSAAEQAREAAQGWGAAFAAGAWKDHDEFTSRVAATRPKVVVAAGARDAAGAVQYAWKAPQRAGRESGTVEVALRDAQGAAAGALVVSYAAANAGALFPFVGGALVVSLGVYWYLYRRLLTHTLPFAALERSLRHHAQGIEGDLRALQLSDSLGTVAQAWNGLVLRIAQLERQGGAPAEQSDALRRFEAVSLRTALDRLPVGVLRVSPDERITYANAAVARLLGRAAEELTDQVISDVLDAERVRPLLSASRRPADETLELPDRDGQTRRAMRLQVAVPKDGEPDQDRLLVLQDVTHLREMEQARDNFLYHVTHELRTPLTNIHAYAETLTRPDFDDEQTRKECYNVIVSETNRLSKLVEDILSISQLEVGSLRLELGDVDLLRLMREMVQDNLGAADEKGVDLTLKAPPKTPIIRGDKRRLAVLLNNLIGNAIKYTPAAGRVDVSLLVEGRWIRVVVRDSGIGISEADQPKVFEKFYRCARDEVQAVAGTGLGLAIGREIAHLHGGDIRVASAMGQGSTFTVDLPINAREEE